MKCARELNYTIELIQDGSENFLYYPKEKRAIGKTLFNKYIEFIYNLKVAGGLRKHPEYKNEEMINTYIKLLLSSLWGLLCEEKKFFYTIKADGTGNYKEFEGDEILRITPSNNGDTEYEIRNINNPYKTRFSRMKVFLLSQGRYKMSSMLSDNVENVVRVQTDGFMVVHSDKKYDIKTDIGHLKLEYEGNVKIKNVNRIEYLNKK